MTTLNAPLATVLWDTGYQVTILINGVYTSACSASNTLVLQANTLHGANNALSCIVDCTGAQVISDLANGFAVLEYIGSNANSAIITLGSGQIGGFDGPVYNPLGANATGDINLFLNNIQAGDNFTIKLSFRKNNSGNPNPWANVESTPSNRWV